MALKRISDLQSSTALVGDELVELSQVSTTVTITSTAISALAVDNSFNDSAAGFLAAGFSVGDRVRVTGFSTAANNLVAGTITALTADKLTIGGVEGDAIVDESSGQSVTISKWTSVKALLSEIGIGGGGGSGLVSVDLPVSNGDLETGDATGWTANGSAPSIEARVGGNGSWDSLLDSSWGDYVMSGGTNSASEYYQEIDVTSYEDKSPTYTIGGWIAQDDVAVDEVEFIAELRDIGGTVIASVSKSRNSVGINQDDMNLAGAAGGVTLRLRVVFTKAPSGGYINACADNFSVSVEYVDSILPSISPSDAHKRLVVNSAGDQLELEAIPYDLFFNFSSTPSADEVIGSLLIPRAVILPANLTGSLGNVGTNPTLSFAMSLKDDGVEIGTVTIDTGGVFSFTTTGGTSKDIATGSVVTLEAPSSPDASIADVLVSISASVT